MGVVRGQEGGSCHFRTFHPVWPWCHCLSSLISHSAFLYSHPSLSFPIDCSLSFEYQLNVTSRPSEIPYTTLAT
jgi:hypothetical protein